MIPGIALVVLGGAIALTVDEAGVWPLAAVVAATGFFLLARRLTRIWPILIASALAGPLYVLGLYLREHMDGPSLLTIGVAALCVLVGLAPTAWLLAQGEIDPPR